MNNASSKWCAKKFGFCLMTTIDDTCDWKKKSICTLRSMIISSRVLGIIWKLSFAKNKHFEPSSEISLIWFFIILITKLTNIPPLCIFHCFCAFFSNLFLVWIKWFHCLLFCGFILLLPLSSLPIQTSLFCNAALY